MSTTASCLAAKDIKPTMVGNKAHLDIFTCIWIIANVGSSFIFLLAFLARYFKFPSFISNLHSWGKVRQTSKSQPGRWQGLNVPNRYFTHMYFIGSVNCGVALLCSCFLLNGNETNYYVRILLNMSSTKVSGASVVLGLLCIFVQTLRRLHESVAVTQFGSSIHLAHYLAGIGFYSMLPLTLLVSMPVETNTELQRSISMMHVCGTLLFGYASLHQHRCHVILSRLKSKIKHGGHPHEKYKVPHGDWFQYVSSPHYLAEILIYTSINLIFGMQSRHLWLILLFVIMTLVPGALKTHKWYNKTFEYYPKERTALIPYIL